MNKIYRNTEHSYTEIQKYRKQRYRNTETEIQDTLIQ